MEEFVESRSVGLGGCFSKFVKKSLFFRPFCFGEIVRAPTSTFFWPPLKCKSAQVLLYTCTFVCIHRAEDPTSPPLVP